MKKDKKLVLPLFNKSELFRNTSILITGTVLAQMIPILLQPIIRRYYTPEAFGAFAVYQSLIGIIIVVSSLKYELAIILPRKDKEAANIFFLAFSLNFGINLLLFFVIVLWGKNIFEFLNLSGKFANYLYFVPLGAFLFSLYQCINYWLIRKKAFFAVSKNKLFRRGAEGGGQIGFKFINRFYGLVYGDLIGHMANITSGAIQATRRGLDLRLVSVSKLKYVFNKYIEYPKFNVIPSFLSVCSFLLPAIFINKYYSSEYTGYFDLSKLVLSIPLALIATSIANVLLQRVSEQFKNKDSFVKELLPILFIVIAVAIGEIIVISIWGINLFEFVFGKEWSFSGSISKILVWSFALNFIVGSFSSIFISMKKIKLLSIWQLFYFLSILSLILFKNRNFISFLKIYLLIEVVCYISIIILMVIIVVKYESKIKQIKVDN